MLQHFSLSCVLEYNFYFKIAYIFEINIILFKYATRHITEKKDKRIVEHKFVHLFCLTMIHITLEDTHNHVHHVGVFVPWLGFHQILGDEH